MLKQALILFLFSVFLYAESASETASRLGNQANAKYGSKSGVQANATEPLQTDKQLTTLNGDGFDARISGCTSTDKQIGINFSATGNSVVSMLINQNNGNTYSASNIVGVCSNGFITNASGSWQPDNLLFKKWLYNKVSNEIYTIDSNSNDLMQCECTTSNCGYTSLSKSTTDTLISGIVFAVSNTNNNIIIGSITNNDFSYTIKMTDNSNCSPSNKYSGQDPQNYYSSQTLPPIDNGTLIASDGNDPNSLYNIMSTQNDVVVDPSAGNVTMNNIEECYIKNTVHTKSDGTLEAITKNTCEKYESDSNCTLAEKIVCDYDEVSNCIYIIKNGSATGAIIPNHCIAIGTKQVCDDGSSIKVFEGGSFQYNILTGTNSFFYTRYRYTCGKSVSSVDRSNINRVYESIEIDGGSGKFSYVNNDGVRTDLTAMQGGDCLIQWCSIRKTEFESEVFADNTTDSQETQDGSQSHVLLYKQCVQSGTNYTCPLEDNSVLIENCGCDVGNAGMAQTYGMLDALQEITGDFTCSK